MSDTRPPPVPATANASRRSMNPETGKVLRCTGWHCNRCGSPTNSYGHHTCPDRPEVVA